MKKDDKCWCGSEKLYADCHLTFDQELEALRKKGNIVPPKKLIKRAKRVNLVTRYSYLNI